MIMKKHVPVSLMARIINHCDAAAREPRIFPVGNYYERICDAAMFRR